MLKQFKEFALRGNVIDLAVGVIIGGAFGKIVSSLVNDIFMPILGILVGGLNFKTLRWIIVPAHDAVAEVAIGYGSFIQSAIDFLIIAMCIFLFIKLISIRRKKPEVVVVAAPPAPTKEEVLLTEIRDILKEGQK